MCSLEVFGHYRSFVIKVNCKHGHYNKEAHWSERNEGYGICKEKLQSEGCQGDVKELPGDDSSIHHYISD